MTMAKRPEAGGGLPAVRAQMEPGPYMPSSPEDYAMPELRLAQAMSKAAQGTGAIVQPGMYYCPQTGESWAEFPGVVLRVQATRSLFGEGLAGPICASDDGEVPRAGGSYPGPCASCRMRLDNPWAVKTEERRKMCNRGFALLLLHATTNQPYAFRVHGASVGPYRGLNTVFRTKYGFRPFAVEIRLTAEQVKNELGQFYVSVPLAKAELPPERVAAYEQQALALMGVRLTAAEGDMEEAGGGLPVKGAPDAQKMRPITRPVTRLGIPEPSSQEEQEDDLPF